MCCEILERLYFKQICHFVHSYHGNKFYFLINSINHFSYFLYIRCNIIQRKKNNVLQSAFDYLICQIIMHLTTFCTLGLIKVSSYMELINMTNIAGTHQNVLSPTCCVPAIWIMIINSFTINTLHYNTW